MRGAIPTPLLRTLLQKYLHTIGSKFDISKYPTFVSYIETEIQEEITHQNKLLDATVVTKLDEYRLERSFQSSKFRLERLQHLQDYYVTKLNERRNSKQ